MRKITILVVMFFVSSMAFAQFPAPYCGPITFTNNEEPITLVNFAGINNTSPNTLAGVAHQDFTAIVGNVTAGQTYPITLKGNTDGNFNTNLSVFIDWNQDGDFTDSGETYNIGSILNSTGLDTVELTGSITASATALGGNTRMRVVKKFNNSTTVFPDSCNTGGAGWGEAEDYTLSVTSILPCLTGVLFPENTVTPATCNGFTSNLVSDESYAGDYFNVNVTTGQTYRFSSEFTATGITTTDFFTISTDGGTTAAASGVNPFTWVSTVTGVIRVHINTDSSCGTENVDRITEIVCGVTCLNGTGPYPTATYTPAVCDGTTVNIVTQFNGEGDSWAGEYSNVNLVTTSAYTISSSVTTDYITISDAAGTTVLAVGTGTVDFTPTADGVYRIYFHTNNTCGAQNTNREKRIVCDTAVVVPGCASNPAPADAAIVPAFDDVVLSWDAPTTGDPATSYDIYIGNSPTTLNFAANVPTNAPINGGPVGAYDTTIYWQIVPRNSAGPAVGCAVWMFTTASQPTDTPDFVNLQFPPTITINEGGSDTVYGQVYEAGLTDVAPNIVGQAPGILAWVGISPVGDNSNPDTWTNWTPATWNAGSVGNNDEYQLAIGANLAPGTYYYTTRFTLNGGPFVYGGLNNGSWNATTNPSGVLTVNPAPVPANDECAGAIALTPGGNFAANPLTTTNVGATDTTAATPGCQADHAADVWYTVVVPASGNITIETQTNGGMTDSVVAVFSGTCGGTLTQVGCDDDGGPAGPNTLMSILSLTGQTPGSTLYIGVWRYSLGGSVNGSFVISAYDASLTTSSFDAASFTAYPNPVVDELNVSYSQSIDKVQVINLLGQEVITKSVNATQGKIDMSNLPTGTYLVKVTANNEVKTIKVIKE